MVVCYHNEKFNKKDIEDAAASASFLKRSACVIRAFLRILACALTRFLQLYHFKQKCLTLFDFLYGFKQVEHIVWKSTKRVTVNIMKIRVLNRTSIANFFESFACPESRFLLLASLAICEERKTSLVDDLQPLWFFIVFWRISSSINQVEHLVLPRPSSMEKWEKDGKCRSMSTVELCTLLLYVIFDLCRKATLRFWMAGVSSSFFAS